MTKGVNMCNEEKAVVKTDTYLTDLTATHKLCDLLMKTPHYAKMGSEGIFAVVETAKSLGIDPRIALGGGLYYARGKVEMSARAMGALIRKHKHSITKDAKSTDKICILNGKRADNGDTWTASFSLEEAQKAGLTKNQTWQMYQQDMLYARALTRLARQLFPDVIGNVYITGEIDDENSAANVDEEPVKEDTISPEQVEALTKLFDRLSDEQKKAILAKAETKDFADLTKSQFETAKNYILKLLTQTTEADNANN
jgi:hypothetical protein